MEEQIKTDDLQSRRDFFKKTVSKVLPILGAVVLGQTIMTSCDPIGGGSTSDSCTGSSCKGSCDGSCSGGCDDSCIDYCSRNCSHTCTTTCYGASRRS